MFISRGLKCLLNRGVLLRTAVAMPVDSEPFTVVATVALSHSRCVSNSSGDGGGSSNNNSHTSQQPVANSTTTTTTAAAAASESTTQPPAIILTPAAEPATLSSPPSPSSPLPAAASPSSSSSQSVGDATVTPPATASGAASAADQCDAPSVLALLETALCDLMAAQAKHKPPSAVDSLCRQVIGGYKQLSPSEQLPFFQLLVQRHGVDQKAIVTAANRLASSTGSEFGASVEMMVPLLQPGYVTIFRQLGRVEGGVKFLVDMRADLLRLCSQSECAVLARLSQSLRELLNMWFSIGFLQLERITWQSPCDMLEKVSEYEAVHPVRNWTDLKRRVGAFRRCFVFTHYSMPREPIVVLHTALTSSICSSIVDIVRKPRQISLAGQCVMSDGCTTEHEDSSQINTAVFYSISSTQKGLQGIEMGNVLIKRVVCELLAEFPHMTQFSSLSPIPGFKTWLLTEINKAIRGEAEILTPAELDQLASHLQLPTDPATSPAAAAVGAQQQQLLEQLKRLVQLCSWLEQDAALSLLLKPPLLRACARYLYCVKRRGFALDSVANFHLRNGAVMWRLNWAADLTPRGLTNSCGIMVNYRYYLEDTQRNSEQYLTERVIAASDSVIALTARLPAPLSPHTPTAHL